MQNSFKCDIREKHFPKNVFSEKHVSRDHGEKKTFKCDLCDANYGSKQTLKNHMGSKHAEEILRDLAFGTTD